MSHLTTHSATNSSSDDYSNGSKPPVDVVMKGGITSGVVYPLAVCELARTYRLNNIGGSSAGAIAASAAAAAEYGRGAGGFHQLARLPDWLAKNLFSLFQPQVETEKLFDLLTAGMGQRWWNALWRIPRAVLLGFPLDIMIGAFPGLVLLLAAPAVTTGFVRMWIILSGVLMMVIGAVLGLVAGIYFTATRALPSNHFGLCLGLGGPRPTTKPALTQWLTERLEQLAGRSEPATPLTFGHLWLGPGRDPEASAETENLANAEASIEARIINLELMTTSLGLGAPFRLPFESEDFFFHPDEFRDFFPEEVVEYMIGHPPPAQDAESLLRRRLLEPLRPLPEAAHFPIVVATRMSLSFPGLMSAVPLWAVDWSRKRNQEAKQAWRRWLGEHQADWDELRQQDPATWPNRPVLRQSLSAEHCYFSDGGIGSNFPVHFFDAVLPRWPTFGINLRPFHPDYPKNSEDESQNVYLPKSNIGGLGGPLTNLEPLRGRTHLFRFASAIADTMQNWRDNAQMRVPGYRDRVAHVFRTATEGGMNLNMPDDVIQALTERGRSAGRRLAEHFARRTTDGVAPAWDNQRWIRYRTFMSSLEESLFSMRRAFDSSAQPTYQQLIIRDDDTPPNGYRWERNAQRDFADAVTQSLVNAAANWEDQGERLAEGTPRPVPALRVVPRV